jgi:HEAT repeat protein
LISLLFSISIEAKVRRPVPSDLLVRYQQNLNKIEMGKLKKDTLKKAGKAVPALVAVMKSSKYPDKNRWMATFLLGQITGTKGVPFIAKFLKHPHWVMRMASMKTLLALKQKGFGKEYAASLKDKSFLVRKQALENIDRLQLTDLAPQVWAMLYDKRNYYASKKGKKRTNLIKEAIRVVGRLKFQKAKTPLLSMVQKKKYEDIFEEIDYSLSLILQKKSPDGNLNTKRRYWSRIAISEKTI